MRDREQIIQVARAEVGARTLAITRQLLTPHDLPRHADGPPVVARVAPGIRDGLAVVYFPLHGEPYYCAITVGPDGAGRLTVLGVRIQAGVRVTLGIYGGELPPTEISTRTGLSPTETHVAGDRQAGGRVYPEHVWRLEALAGAPAPVEEKLDVLLRAVEPATRALVMLSEDALIEISVVYNGWAGDPQFGGIHIRAADLRRIADLGAEFDIDLYAHGPPMPEDIEDHPDAI